MLKGMATLVHPHRNTSPLATVSLLILVAALLVALAPIVSNAALRVSPTPEFIGDGSPAAGPNPEGRPTTLINVVENLDTSVQYLSLQDAIDAAAPGETLQFLVASHAEGAQISVGATKTGITLLGMSGGTTLTPLASTGTSGNARGWLLIEAEDVTVRDLTFDGTGVSIYQAIRILADGALIEDCTFVHLYGLPASAYDGRGVASVNSSTTVVGCDFSDIKRIGIHLFGPSSAPSLVSGNTMTGKGPGDWIDYGVELGGGATALIEENTITDCVGVALSDGSGSAGILVTDFFAPGTAGTVRNNFVNDNSAAVALGYLPGDASVLVAEDNDFSANDYGVVNAGATVPNASLNWWGSNLPGDVAAYQDGAVDYTPWLHDGTDTGGPGFEGDRATLYVDDDSPQTGAVGRIQEGVNSVTASTVNIMPGTYEEQVLIDGMDVTLQGSGRAVTFINSPVSLATHFVVSGNPNKSVVTARNADDVQIRDLTVDGLGRANGNFRMYGIGFWNAGGKVLDCDITGIRQTPMNGSQHGVGIGAYNDDGGPYSLEIGGCDIDDFQKNGMALSGANLDVDVHDCTVRGSGDVSVIAQNGIQVSFGAGGLVRDCAISDLRYTPASFVSSGLLVYQPGADVNVSGLDGPNAITDVQAPVSWYDGNGSLDGIEVAGTIVPGQDYGAIFIGNFSTALVVGGGGELTAFGRPGPAPMDGAGDASGGTGLDGRTGTGPEAFIAYNVDVTNSCLTGADVVNTVGVYAYTGGGPLSVSVANSVVADWDYGLLADGAAASLTANANAVVGNVTAGYDNTLSLSAQDASGNWWGDQTGPSGDGPGFGDAVSGAGVGILPWLSNGGDSDPGCAFVPAADNVVTAGPGGCLSTVNTCLTVPVDIARTDAIPMRGFSVRVDLSPELELCLGVASIVEGSYLSDVVGSTTNFQVIDNGGGSYTVDGVILGSPCGAVDPSGTLFTIDVKRTIPDGTGTITITPIKARDCSNAPIPVSPGPPLEIDIDTTPPAAIADLAAAQQKTGNDSDGTTKINLTFTPPGDADQLLVYRAGFGNYPEYDDAPGAGSIPATPSYPPPAPWVLATTLPGSATSYADEVLARDFWHFIVFSEDGCGNVSAVSNQTGGTLNYHLGDTHNGSSDCAGDNLVNTADISFLGANYGTLLGPSDPLGCLDVGPTTDFSVDARPTTDNILDFEDLIVFAINYGLVSKPGAPPRGDVSGRNELALVAPDAASDVLVVDLVATGAGDIQGLSIDLAWNAAVVEPIGVEAGELLHRQDRSSSVLSSRPGNVDVALLGVGAGLSGSGTVAQVRFRVVGAGDPGVSIEQVSARDRGNRVVEVALATTAGGAPRAVTTRLGAGMPNPFRHAVDIPMAVSADGVVRVSVFDVLGRPVRTLLEAPVPAGERLVSWDGLDASGQRAPSGLYVVRLEAGGEVRTRTIHLVR
jgi:hypothetical protein